MSKSLSQSMKLIFLAINLFLIKDSVLACPDIDNLTDRNCDQKLIVVAFGDSITRGVRDEDGLGYPARLKLIHPNIKVVNFGNPGERTDKGKVRVTKTVPYVPDADYAIFLEGVNDYFEKDKAYSKTKDHLLYMLKVSRETGIQSFLGNLTDIKRTTTQVQWVNGVNSAIRPYKSIDFHSLGKSIISYDKLHPNGSGYQTMASLVSSKLTAISLENKPEDLDHDGIYDFAEQKFGSSVNVADTDGDGILDGAEIFTYHSNPNSLDSDGDGFSDNFEVNTLHSDPSDPNPTAPKIKTYQIIKES